MLNPINTRRKNAQGYVRTLMCTIAVFVSVGAAYAQTGHVILAEREVTAAKALGQITHQTQYSLTVDWSILDAQRMTLLSGNVLTVGDLLRQVLSGTGCTYQVSGNHIIIVTGQPDDAGLSDGGSDGRTGYWSSRRSDGESIEFVMLNFRVARSLLERAYMDNNYSLDALDRTLYDRRLAENVESITITAAASPEGNAKQNMKLAEDRAKAIRSYIMWKHPQFDRSRIVIHTLGEDWAGLRKMVANDGNVPSQREVLELLDSGISNDLKKKRLRIIANGRTYSYIAKNILPYLRGGAACMICYKGGEQDAGDEYGADATNMPPPEIRYVERVRVDTVYIERETVTEVIVEIPPKPQPKEKKIYYLALKTNLLYDAVLLPNLALEFSLPRRWSIEVEGHWSWWNTNTGKHLFHRVQVGGAEVRKWLGPLDRTPFSGHYVGVYGMGGNYDVRLGNIGHLGEYGSWSVGLTYGFGLPVSRSFNFEFGVGLGYFGGEYKKYTYDPDNDRYPWQSDHRRNYFGITKAKVSLVWLVGTGKNRK